MSSRIERELDESFARSDYDHRKLRLLRSPPGLRLVGIGMNYTEVLSGVTTTTGNYGCSAAHPKRIRLVRIRRLFRNERRPKYFYTEWTQLTDSARSVYEALSKGVHLLKSRSSRSPHELDIEEEFFP
jgi:hypothetical protein